MNDFLQPGHHPLEQCAKFGKMNPVDFHLERLHTFLRWNREHFASFRKYRESDPENSERELEFLDDTIERGYEHLGRLTELLRAGIGYNTGTARDNQHNPDPNQNAARIVSQATADQDAPAADLEAAWAEWSAHLQKVDERAMTLLRAAFEAGWEAAKR